MRNQSMVGTAVLDKDENILNKEEVQKRWAGHFKEVLNREQLNNPIGFQEEARFEFGELIEEIVGSELYFEELRNAITNLKNGNIDNVTAEIWKADAEFSAKKVHGLFSKVWRNKPTHMTGRRG